MRFLKALLLCGLSVAVADGLWFSFALSHIYTPLMGALINPQPNLIAAVLFYLLFAAGLSYFVIWRALNHANPSQMQACLEAAFFGLVTYGTYDLTAMAVIAGWSWPLSLIDMAWGAANSVMATLVVTTLLKSKLQKG